MGVKLLIKKIVRHYKKKGETTAKDHELYCLTRQPDNYWIYTLDEISKDVVKATSLTKADLDHAYQCLADEIRKHLVHGDRVKIDKLGTFYMGIASESVENPEDLSVRSVQRAFVRFLPDVELKLVNNATATTRSDNNVTFSIIGKEGSEEPATGQLPGGNNPGSGAGGGTGGDEDIDPEA